MNSASQPGPHIAARTTAQTIGQAAPQIAAAALPAVLPPGSVPLAALAIVAFTEGPAAAADGSVYFSDIFNNRILRYRPGTGVSVFREPSGRTNGQTFDNQGRLLHCEGSEFGPGGRRRVARTDLTTGEYTVLSERFEGARYNSPNDICVDAQDRIYFTDPRYGDRSDLELGVDGVYRLDPDGAVTRILDNSVVERPNGIAVTQSGDRLYVVDSCPEVGGHRKVWRFALDAAGFPHEPKVMIDFAPGRGGDGMRLDREGNLYIAAGIKVPRHPGETADVPPGIYVVSPRAELLGRIPVDEDVLTNLAFGGADGRTLFVTAGKTLFTTRVGIPGQVAWPRWAE